NSEIRSTSESIINGLRAANTQAANLNVPTGVVFTVRGSGNTWTGWDITYQDENGNTQTVQQMSRSQIGKIDAVTATPASFVTFNGLGRVEQVRGPQPHMQTIDICIESCAPGYQYRPLRIIVDDPAVGSKNALRMCDPDPNLKSLSPPDPRAC